MISKSTVSLFDITTWNPNVALELGLAIGLQKEFYILFDPTKEEAEVPSDIRGRERIQYESLAQLRAKLSIALQKHVIAAAEDTSEELEGLKGKIVECLAHNQPLPVKEICAAVGVTQGIATAIVADMKEAGTLEMVGAKKGAKYRLTN